MKTQKIFSKKEMAELLIYAMLKKGFIKDSQLVTLNTLTVYGELKELIVEIEDDTN